MASKWLNRSLLDVYMSYKSQDVIPVEAADSAREGAEEELGRSEPATPREHPAHQSQQVLHGGREQRCESPGTRGGSLIFLSLMVILSSHLSSSLLTLGVPVQLGLWYLVCEFVSVCLLPRVIKIT